MKSDKVQTLSTMSNRQKITAGIMVVVLLIIVWQIWGLFGGGSPKTTPAPVAPAASTMTASAPGGSPNGSPNMQQPTGAPKIADIMQGPPQTEREAMLMKLQAETQAKYLQAMSELQILKVNKEIAVTDKDISTAKLAKVVAEKKIYDLLTPPAPPSAAEAIKTPNGAAAAPLVTGPLGEQEIKYTVISVSQLEYKWTAVIGFKGNIFSVHVGDVLPPDGSTVTSIGRNGVTLEKDGVKQKISLVTAG